MFVELMWLKHDFTSTKACLYEKFMDTEFYSNAVKWGHVKGGTLNFV